MAREERVFGLDDSSLIVRREHIAFVALPRAEKSMLYKSTNECYRASPLVTNGSVIFRRDLW